MTDTTLETVALIAELRGVYDNLTPGAIERANLDGMAFSVQRAINAIEATTALQAERDRLRVALLQTQMMLEQIAHLKSTDFTEVARRIIAIRTALKDTPTNG